VTVSVLYIGNLALSHLGDSGRVADLNENTKAAYYVRLHYEQARDDTLAAAAWGFARKFQALADLGDPPDQWTYRYALPTDCVTARNLVDTTGLNLHPEFELAIADTLDQVCVLTDEPEAVLCYTARVEQVALFPAPFVDALALRLADYLCRPLTGDTKLKAKLQADYLRALSMAQTHDANQGSPERNRTPDHLAARA